MKKLATLSILFALFSVSAPAGGPEALTAENCAIRLPFILKLEAGEHLELTRSGETDSQMLHLKRTDASGKSELYDMQVSRRGLTAYLDVLMLKESDHADWLRNSRSFIDGKYAILGSANHPNTISEIMDDTCRYSVKTNEVMDDFRKNFGTVKNIRDHLNPANWDGLTRVFSAYTKSAN